ncbi:MAG: hypothetical protein IJ722_06375 [Alloprevotella sp.]|nr:hypothetical protein [Alloprevotella sp.]
MDERMNEKNALPVYNWFISESECAQKGTFYGNFPEDLLSKLPPVSFDDGVEWEMEGFLSNAQFPNGCSDGAIGIYEGQSFVLNPEE